ncbi:MAG: outer membrane lipid asymmetry maintenance protein MlaD [Gammaproteobacteria bacterium]|nr:MAG: outer membrane lipid asymmetry maintenance protein MlaD [Gammaproteobacteria bacterium]
MHKWIETAVGLFVAAGAAALFMLAMKVSNLSMWQAKGYDLFAHFENVGGLKVRAPVTLAGVTIGRVAAIELDKERYEAKVTLRIEPRYDNLPRDTSASIYTAGLLGENYVALEPGGEDVFLKPGDEIKLTQSAMILERMIGQFLFSKAQEGASP